METFGRNREYGDRLKEILGLRHEPVAVRLIRCGEKVPDHPVAEGQMSHCQAVSKAAGGGSFVLMSEGQSCKVGASALGMAAVPDKVGSGEFHFGIGAHDTLEAAARMVAERPTAGFEAVGAAYSPLGEARFEPDVVIITDVPERIYWSVPLSTAADGGRAVFSTAPFQAACVDCTAAPMATGSVNISLGCFGCRKRSGIGKDEMLVGIPFSEIPGMVGRLERYRDGIMTRANRE